MKMAGFHEITGKHREDTGRPNKQQAVRNPFRGTRPPVPRFLTGKALGEEPWNFCRDVWPLIEARLPASSVSRATDPLITALRDRGEAEESAGLLKVRPADRRLLDRSDTPHPRRFAFGPWVVGGRATGGFARPGFNAPLFRHADALARIVLSETVATQISHVA